MESRASLLGGDLDRSAVQDQHPTVDVSIPAIDGVHGAATRGPYGQIEPERRRRKDDECDPAQHPLLYSLGFTTRRAR
jgi:hypothetical protein